jgi:Uma2 family endonuclease
LEHELGDCFDAPFDVVLADDTVVQPDFTYVSADRLPELYDGHCITGAPDLVFEVLSASTESRDRHQKRPLYADAGVPWMLFVEPAARVVEVLRLNNEGKYVVEDTAAGDEKLEFELFPGLSSDLSKVWFTPPEPPSDD